MSEQLPYKNEQWDDLPLPDGEASWDKMELLLEKDKRRRVVPFWLWRYAALGLLLIGVGVGGWMWLHLDANKEPLPRIAKEKIQEHKQANVPTDVQTKDGGTINTKQNRSQSTSSTGNKKSVASDVVKQPFVVVQKQATTIQLQAVIITKGKRIRTTKSKADKVKLSPQKNRTVTVQSGKPIINSKKNQTPITTTNSTGKQNNIDSLQLTTESRKDSTDIKDSVKTVSAPPVIGNENKKEKKKKSSFLWSAGVGFQQPIAVKGQQSSTYNYNGKKNAFSDHLPSLYLRLQKNKLFAQAEFQFGVPQPVEQFFFSQKTKYDVANLTLNTERFTIQKLYYHQLPISINYYLLPNLSVGAGGVYNILAGAVTEKEINSKSVVTGLETTMKNIAPVKGFKDSFLYKTTAGILIQTDYHWKRFSLGLRFTQNLQPFIKYTKPDGTILNEKTLALQAILRFRLWANK